MKIGYMGTPQFAVPALKALWAAGQSGELPVEVVFAVTQPDKARNRGKKVQPTPVKEAALEMGIPVLQPVRVKENPEFYQTIQEFAPDVIVVAAYGKILPVEILRLPAYGCVNIHASLLPRYRGAAPIQRSIMEGEKETGVTLMYMAEGLDTGDMIAQASMPIRRQDAQQVHDRLAEMGAELLLQTLPAIEEGKAPRQAQEDRLSCYAPMVRREEGKVNWSRSAEEIDRQLRGLAIWPGAFTLCEGQQMKLKKADCVEGDLAGEARMSGRSASTESDPGCHSGDFTFSEGDSPAFGTVLAVSEEGIDVLTGDGVLRIRELQLPGKKPVSAADFLRGHTLLPGTVLG